VSQRHRAMTLHEVPVTGTGTSTSDRLRRSPSGSRYRTLEDRAYRHPDVPHSPLYSDLDHGPSAQDAYHTGPSFKELSNVRNDPQVSSPETRNTPFIHSRNPSSSEVYSRNASPRPPVPRPHMPPSHIRNGSYPARKRPVQGHVHRPGYSLDSRPGSSFTVVAPLPSTQGIGLSLIDNGAFEAPRPAPEPRIEKAVVVQRVPVPVPVVVAPAAGKEPTSTSTPTPTTDDASPKRDSDSVAAFSLSSLSGFPRRVLSKRQKQPTPRLEGLRRRLGSACSSELDLNSSSSFINMVENEPDHPVVKPQRKGLSLFKRK